MINGLWLGILLSFAALADITMQKSDYEGLDWYPDALKPKVEQIVFDRIEIIGDDMYIPVKDTIYMLDEKLPKIPKKYR